MYFLGGSSSALELDIVSKGETENFRSCIFKMMMMMKSNKADFIKIYYVTFFGLGYDSDMDSIYTKLLLYF